MFTHIGRVCLVGLLFAQEPYEPPSLETLELRTRTLSSPHAMVTIVVTHKDGTPMRGYVRCLGWWFKYEDDPNRSFAGDSFPFATDSRGVVVMNPHLEDEWIHCWADDKGKHGEVSVSLAGRHVVQMVLDKREE